MNRRESWSKWPISVERFIDLLRHYRGAANAISAKTIGLHLGCRDDDPGRAVREAARAARKLGYPIGAIASAETGKPGGGGYYWAVSQSDFERTIAQLAGQAGRDRRGHAGLYRGVPAWPEASRLFAPLAAPALPFTTTVLRRGESSPSGGAPAELPGGQRSEA